MTGGYDRTKGNMTTIKLTNKYQTNEGGQWFCKPEEAEKLAYIKRTLAECQRAEPDQDWHLETRGTESVMWHRWQS